MSTVHDFRDSLKKSHSAESLPLWEECYRKAFDPYFGSMHNCRKDGDWQRTGIDRIVFLENGETVRIDEKIRWKNYGDICLEYLSSRQHKTPGWVCKMLRADYIAYAIAPLGKCYMLPVIPLQQAWKRCGEKWLELGNKRTNGYFICPSQNRGYTTMNVAVPVNELFSEIGKALRVGFCPVPEKVCVKYRSN